MKTIHVTIDESLLEDVDKLVGDLKATRSAFIRSALRLALWQHVISKLERQHEEGYATHPVTPGEFDVWEGEQAWESQSAVGRAVREAVEEKLSRLEHTRLARECSKFDPAFEKALAAEGL